MERFATPQWGDAVCADPAGPVRAGAHGPVPPAGGGQGASRYASRVLPLSASEHQSVGWGFRRFPSGPSRSPPTEDPTVKIAIHRSMQQSRPCRLGRCADCGGVNRSPLVGRWSGAGWLGIDACAGGHSTGVNREKGSRCRKTLRTPWSSAPGPNGLVAANVLADAGWDVVVLEASRDRRRGALRRGHRARLPQRPVQRVLPAGGRVAGAARPGPGASTGCAGGTRRTCWRMRCADGRAAVLSTATWTRDRGELEEFAPGDGAGWLERARDWQRDPRPAAGALFTPFPPVRGGGPAAAPARASPARWIAPGSRCCRCAGSAEELFRGDGGRLLLAGNAMHTRPAAGRGRQRRVRLAAGDARPGGRLPGARGRRRSGSPTRSRPGSCPAAAASPYRAPGRAACGHRRPGHAACARRRQAWSARGGRCWPTCRRRRSTATWSGWSALPAAAGAATWTGSSGTPPRSRSTGR